MKSMKDIEQLNKKLSDKLTRSQVVRKTEPDHINLPPNPTAPHVRNWWLTAKHLVQAAALGHEDAAAWWDEIKTTTNIIKLNDPGELFKSLDMKIKTCMLKNQGT